MKFTSILIASTIVSILLATFLFFSWDKERRRRIQSEQTTVSMAKLDSLKTYLVLTLAQIKQVFPEMEKRIKTEFNQKLNNVLSIATAKIETNNTFHTFIKDSTNFKMDTIPFKYIAYKDSFTDFEASQIGNELYVTRNLTTVPITGITYKEPWRLKFVFPWNWGKRRTMYDLKSSNHRAIIKCSQFIQVQK